MSRALSELDGLDVMMMNTDVQHRMESILDMVTNLFDGTMKTNVYVPFCIIRAALPYLKPGSPIIATISEQAYKSSDNVYVYPRRKPSRLNFVKSNKYGPGSDN
jgi:hypothetical protein